MTGGRNPTDIITKIVNWWYCMLRNQRKREANQLLWTEVSIYQYPWDKSWKLNVTTVTEAGSGLRDNVQLWITSVNAHFSLELVNPETPRCPQALLSREEELASQISSDGPTHGA
jgi:hypothetical protein